MFKNLFVDITDKESFKIPYFYLFVRGIHRSPVYISLNGKVRIVTMPWRHHGIQNTMIPSHWRHNDHDGVSNRQPHGCLLNRLFRHRSKKTPKLRVTGLCVGNSPGPVNSPHKGPVTRKMFPFDDVIMSIMEVLYGNSQFLTYVSI